MALWTYIDPSMIDPRVFGLHKIVACKIMEYHGTDDIRLFRLRGWITFADLVDCHPVTGLKLPGSTWFTWAAKGE